MARKGQYSDKYGFNISHLMFDCCEQAPSTTHGTLTTQGIEGAQPKRFTSERARPPPPAEEPTTAGISRRRLPAQERNPLEPQYALPQVQLSPLDPPKFLRDTLDVSDIAGATKKEARVPKTERCGSLQAHPDDESSGIGKKCVRGRRISAPRTASLDVSDITGPQGEAARGRPPRKAAASAITQVEDAIGTQNNVQWRQKHFQGLRKHGEDVTRVRREAETLLASIPSAAVPTALPTLNALCKEADRERSGLLQPREFEEAVKRSGLGIPQEQARALSKSLAKSDSANLIEYRQVLGQLYECAVHNIGPEQAESIPKPEWHTSMQRRVKTDVATALGQQPTATAVAAASVMTTQEKLDAARPGCGKKIEGLQRPGGGQGKDGGAYWFADSLKHNGSSGNKGSPGEGNEEHSLAAGADVNAGEGKLRKLDGGLWFAASGLDDRSLKEMTTWRPTKDASIVGDLQKVRQDQKKCAAGEGEVEQQQAPAAGHKGGAPPGTMTSRRAEMLSVRDVESVARLE